MKLQCAKCNKEIKAGNRIGLAIIGDAFGVLVNKGVSSLAIKFDDKTLIEVWCVKCDRYLSSDDLRLVSAEICRGKEKYNDMAIINKV